MKVGVLALDGVFDSGLFTCKPLAASELIELSKSELDGRVHIVSITKQGQSSFTAAIQN